MYYNIVSKYRCKIKEQKFLSIVVLQLLQSNECRTKITSDCTKIENYSIKFEFYIKVVRLRNEQ
jgi:hypothetical protein